jgi:hypothetical protein
MLRLGMVGCRCAGVVLQLGCRLATKLLTSVVCCAGLSRAWMCVPCVVQSKSSCSCVGVPERWCVVAKGQIRKQVRARARLPSPRNTRGVLVAWRRRWYDSSDALRACHVIGAEGGQRRYGTFRIHIWLLSECMLPALVKIGALWERDRRFRKDVCEVHFHISTSWMHALRNFT